MAETSRGHVILCGLGTVGYRVLEELIELGEQVFAVERNADSEFVTRARELGAEVIIGDARADLLMKGLNVRSARAVIIVTDDDLANLEIAMDVRELRADVPIVMRLFDQRLAQKVKPILGVQVSVSTSMVSAPLFAAAALDPRVVGTHRVGGRVMLVIEVVAGQALAGRCVADLQSQYGFGIVALRKADQDWILQPPADEPVVRGDLVQLMVPGDRLDDARALG